MVLLATAWWPNGEGPTWHNRQLVVAVLDWCATLHAVSDRVLPTKGETMRCARFYGAHQPLRLEHIPPPEPTGDEVQVRVRAAGICGTELHFLDGLYAPAKVPMILGHEVAGHVAHVGPMVADLRPGARVVVHYYLFCGRCRWCLRGQQQLCLRPRGVFAFSANGGFAEYVTVPAHCLVPLPDQLPFEEAAPLCCSATTALHAASVAELAAGETAVVLGAGGVGLSLVQVANHRGARVIAVGRSLEKRKVAVGLGADAAATPAEVEGLLKEATDGAGADVVFELVGTAETMPLAVRLLGRRGRLVFVGYSADSLSVSPLALLVAEQRILTSVGNTYAELELAVDLAARGRLKVPIAGVSPLHEVNQALASLRRGEAVGRLVLQP
jgi:propanol-preferring alcohol dehydrogenase